MNPVYLLLLRGLRFIQFAVFVRILLTWVMPVPRQPAIRWFATTVDRVLKPFRVLLPMGGAYLDLGPLLFLLLLEAIQRIVIQLAYSGF
jgi:YggT family protein